MAHFAQVIDGYVRNVIVVSNDEVPDEETGRAFIESLGLSGEWIQTSYNGNPIDGQDRGLYAGTGYTWDGSVFAPPIEAEEETP
jgi:hypothetical protein